MENKEQKLCPFCNAEISTDAKKCKSCGEWVCKQEDSYPEELKRFNWGAFLLNWIWGVMHKQYITLLYFVACIIPVIGPLAISIWFGFTGNKWAWKSKNWESIEQFNDAQRAWVRLWFVLAGFGIILCIKIFLLLSLIGSAKV